MLIQLSLSTHKSKAGDLKKSIGWPECSRRGDDSTFLQYYRKLCAEESPSTMYVYISPKQVDEPNLGESGIRSRTAELYLGVVTAGTETHTLINRLSEYSPTNSAGSYDSV